MDKELLVKLISEKKSIRDISSLCGKSATSIRYWMKKFNLKSEIPKYNKGSVGTSHHCRYCGESDPNEFYGKMKYTCGSCHNRYAQEKGKENRKYIIEKLGGGCLVCGYDKCDNALEVHHLYSEKKDKNWRTSRGWSKGRIDDEINDCVILCSNCHREHHAGVLSLDEYKK
mgnify:CR=1 FL=1|tara:strand:+ start:99 stop:611 length:513 start_codon:yes stop_codon:yes gene_type:complete